MVLRNRDLTRASSELRSGGAPPADTLYDGDAVLKVKDLEVEYRGRDVQTAAVRGIGLTLRAGRIVGMAGESGSGKSASALAIMGLLPPGTRVAGSVQYRGIELLGMTERQLRSYRGRQLAMIFQETGTALNPVIRIGEQLTMAARAHFPGSREELGQRIRDALTDVRLTDHDRVLRSYPHELSGGMCQRVVIAMALSCGSQVLLADEPTTALDVSVQKEILDLIRFLVTDRQLAVLMISHDLAVLAEVCEDLIVMYSGEIVESGPADIVLEAPAHPYTRALLSCLPQLHEAGTLLPELTQAAPAPSDRGCRFRTRCPWRAEACETHPELELLRTADDPRSVRCWRAEEVHAADAVIRNGSAVKGAQA
jgi:peptide/nickel transport system ATP-binding protein